MDKAYETRRLFLKPKCKTFALEKQTRDLEKNGLGEREILHKVQDYLTETYRLGDDKKKNEEHLEASGYVLKRDSREGLEGEVCHGGNHSEKGRFVCDDEKAGGHASGWYAAFA